MNDDTTVGRSTVELGGTTGYRSHLRSHRRVAAGVLAMALVASVAAVVGPPGAGAAPADRERARPRPAGDASSVLAAGALAADFDIPFAEAERRIANQTRLEDIADGLDEAIGEAHFGGVFIDHAHGGALVVQHTRGADLSVLDGLDAPEPVVAREVDHSLAELHAIAESTDRALRANQVDYGYAAIDIEANEVLVGAPVAKGDHRRVDPDARRAIEGTTRSGRAIGTDPAIRIEPGRDISSASCDNTYSLCDSLRGGILMVGDTSACTGGFITRGRGVNAARRYMLTAGHCGNLGDRWHMRTPGGTTHQFGTMVNRTYTRVMDAGIIQINWLFPFGHWVLVQPESWWWQTVMPLVPRDRNYRNFRHPITGVRTTSQLPGIYLCTTGGNYYGTQCGILNPNLTALYKNGGWPNAAVLEVIMCQGNSGSPVYHGNHGYGIVTNLARQPTGLDTEIYNGWWTAYSDCGYGALFMGLGPALNHMNVDLWTG